VKILYLDCFSGISGDMTLGALIDAGLPLSALKQAIGSLALPGVHLHADRVLRAGVSATKFTVHAHDHHESEHHHHEHPAPSTVAPSTIAPSTVAPSTVAPSTVAPSTVAPSAIAPSTVAPSTQHPHQAHRSLSEIFALIDKASLSADGRDRAKVLFQRLAEAEASIHQMPVDAVHLHEVGALDSIIDIVGTVFALEWLGADRIVCSPLNVGGGMVQSAHGLFPVPAPATVRLLGDAPVYGGAVQKELVTPTGALIVSAYATSFGPIPPMSIDHVGYGAGDRDERTTPNVLRVLIGRAADRSATERVTVVECEIDDMNPQIFGVAMDRLYAAGALEVFYVSVQMKKNRPGTLLTVIVPPEQRERIADVIFRETTTIGLRHYDVDRECLEREIVSVETPIGPVRFKIARRNGRVLNATPEFDDCARLAAANNLPVKEVQALVIRAYQP
jgi:uncharacterized protein (TIGR00299 family) protein